MLIEQEKRPARVRFRHPIRVVTLDGQPRVIRTLTANVSRKGLFLRMPQPLPNGTKVALSLEAGGRALALAQAEVMWGRVSESQLPGRYPGCGVKFTEFMHPRGPALIEYLVQNLDRGTPLTLPRKLPLWMRARVPAAAAMVALFVAILAIPLLSQFMAPDSPPVAAAEAVLDSARTERESPLPVEQGEGLAPPVAPAEAVLDSARTERESPLPVATAEAVLDSAPPEPEPAVAPVAPVAVIPEKPVAVAVLASAKSPPRARRAEPKKPDTQRGEVPLPTGAASRLSWSLAGSELRLSPELAASAHLTRAFVLEGPPRVVFDVAGAAPRKSLTVPASPPFATSVRLGKQGNGTRIVIDLDKAPKKSRQDDGALVLSF